MVPLELEPARGWLVTVETRDEDGTARTRSTLRGGYAPERTKPTSSALTSRSRASNRSPLRRRHVRQAGSPRGMAELAFVDERLVFGEWALEAKGFRRGRRPAGAG